MNILVIGGTGMIGSYVLQGLLAKGEQVHVLTRSAGKADVPPRGASGIIGDLRKPETLRRCSVIFPTPSIRSSKRWLRHGCATDLSNT